MLMLQLLCVFLVAEAMGTLTRPSYVECQNSDECGVGRCCVLGAERYSTPTCQDYRGVNDTCRARGHLPIDTLVGYPDGQSVELTNVYFLFCHCDGSLYCDKLTSTCQPSKVIPQ